MTYYRTGGLGTIFGLGALFFIALSDAAPCGAVDSWAGTPHEEFFNSPVRQKYQCDTCHTIGDRGGTAGPRLNQVGRRRSKEWLIKWLSNPQAIKPGTIMPQFPLTPDEIERTATLLSRMQLPVDSAGILTGPGTLADKGAQLARAYDCFACHTIGDEGGRVGPDLTDLKSRKSPGWEKKWLADPQTVTPGTFMPTFGFTPEEIDAIVAYLYQ